MPQIDRAWTQADYDEAYQLNGEPDGHPNTRPGVKLGYHRHVIIPTLDNHWRNLAPRLGLRSGQGIVIVGAGFGWGSECAQRAVPGLACCGTDISPFIQAQKDQTEEVSLRERILAVGLDPDAGRGRDLLGRYWDGGVRTRSALEDERLDSQGSRGRVRGVIGRTPEWVVSEDVLPCLSDAKAIEMAQAADAMNPTGGVLHTVTLKVPPPTEMEPFAQDPGYNWKTADEWRALFDANGLSSHRLIISQCKGEFF